MRVLPGDYASVDIDGTPVAVFNVDGEFFAIDDVCTHDGETLAGGPVEGTSHLPTPRRALLAAHGRALTPPAYEPVRTYGDASRTGAVARGRTMKHLTLVRHAKSDWTLPAKDCDRPLNRRGQREAPGMAQRLAEQHVHVDLLITSPALRALTTATFFRRALE